MLRLPIELSTRRVGTFSRASHPPLQAREGLRRQVPRRIIVFVALALSHPSPRPPTLDSQLARNPSSSSSPAQTHHPTIAIPLPSHRSKPSPFSHPSTFAFPALFPRSLAFASLPPSGPSLPSAVEEGYIRPHDSADARCTALNGREAPFPLSSSSLKITLPSTISPSTAPPSPSTPAPHRPLTSTRLGSLERLEGGSGGLVMMVDLGRCGGASRMWVCYYWPMDRACERPLLMMAFARLGRRSGEAWLDGLVVVDDGRGLIVSGYGGSRSQIAADSESRRVGGEFEGQRRQGSEMTWVNTRSFGLPDGLARLGHISSC
ncbi:hypothetical protein BCR35DRAFT_313116 [Leucosporidium creatinivorum]|uniref:Uncharacterized protein n=1 Tax=Leucosporidium creatinivorum TaxID=106004 RepID=A0A1Y2FVW6_9BASI|nr:hypothetical protein BCR35DRAFT_313116 [Leucosporidium creatinivorum]